MGSRVEVLPATEKAVWTGHRSLKKIESSHVANKLLTSAQASHCVRAADEVERRIGTIPATDGLLRSASLQRDYACSPRTKAACSSQLMASDKFCEAEGRPTMPTIEAHLGAFIGWLASVRGSRRQSLKWVHPAVSHSCAVDARPCVWSGRARCFARPGFHAGLQRMGRREVSTTGSLIWSNRRRNAANLGPLPVNRPAVNISRCFILPLCVLREQAL